MDQTRNHNDDPGALVTFVRGKFGAELHVMDDYLFYPKDTTRSRFYCRSKSCKASVTVKCRDDGVFVADRSPTHDHPNHAEYIAELRHIQRLREEARSGANRHVSSTKVSTDVRLETGTRRRKSIDYRLVRRMRKRRKQPLVAAEIEVFPFLEQNAIFISPDKSIIIFCREWGLRVAATARRMCVDGTFKVAPKTHYQLLTFHATCSNGAAFPIIHVLMSDKSYKSYKTVLRRIEDGARALNIAPVFRRHDLFVSVDFESALIKALRELGVALHGCHFHLCQAVWRFVKAHGMSRRYNTDAVPKDGPLVDSPCLPPRWRRADALHEHESPRG